ncbi:MAG: transglutaminase-like cysteine peptidase [Pseudomonadota bacterium]
MKNAFAGTTLLKKTAQRGLKADRFGSATAVQPVWTRGTRSSISLPPVLKRGSIVSIALLACIAFAPVDAQARSTHLEPQKSIRAPSGFNGLCARYDWVCAPSHSAGLTTQQTFSLAKRVNLSVNRQVREIGDLRQYGKEEHWALPTRRGGDCEDLVLLKKKMLIERGVPSESLLIATVLDKRLNSHAVLVLRTKQGDFVLDNLTNRILPWKDTGYTFLKLQNPRSLSKWQAIMAGGVIQDRPTASR